MFCIVLSIYVKIKYTLLNKEFFNEHLNGEKRCNDNMIQTRPVLKIYQILPTYTHNYGKRKLGNVIPFLINEFQMAQKHQLTPKNHSCSVPVICANL